MGTHTFFSYLFCAFPPRFAQRSQPNVVEQCVANVNRGNWTASCFDRTGQTARVKAVPLPTFFYLKKVENVTHPSLNILPKVVAVEPHVECVSDPASPVSFISLDHQYYDSSKCKVNNQLEAGRHRLGNIQNKNAIPGENAKTSIEDVASLAEFHCGVPTVANVVSYPQKGWVSDFRQEVKETKLDDELIYCGKKCREKFARLLLENKALKQEMEDLRKENVRLSKYDLDLLNETQRRLVRGMFRWQTKSRFNYHPQLLNDTLKLRRMSRSAYIFIKKQFQLPIPSEHILRKYHNAMNRMIEGVTREDSGLGVDGRVPQEVDIDDTIDVFEEVEQVVVNQTDNVFVTVAADVETVEVVSTNSSEQESVADGNLFPQFISTNSGGDKQKSFEDQTGKLPVDEEIPRYISLNSGSIEQTLFQVVNNMDNVDAVEVRTVEAVSANSISDEQVELKVGNETESVLPPEEGKTFECFSTNVENVDGDGQLQYFDQTCNVLVPVEMETVEVGSLNAGEQILVLPM